MDWEHFLDWEHFHLDYISGVSEHGGVVAVILT